MDSTDSRILDSTDFYPAYFGFNQVVAYEMKLDHTDLSILNWFIHFRDSGAMINKIIENEPYYWISYEKVRHDLLCMRIDSERTIQRHLNKLCGNFSDAVEGKEYPLKKQTLHDTDFKKRAYFAVTPGYASLRVFGSYPVTRNDPYERNADPEDAASDIPVQKEEKTVPDYSDEFKSFIETVNQKTEFKVNLYDKNNIPQKSVKTLEKYIEACVKGNFVQKFKPTNIKKELPPITYEQLISILRLYKQGSTKMSLANFFISYQTKYSLFYVYYEKNQPKKLDDDITMEDNYSIEFFKQIKHFNVPKDIVYKFFAEIKEYFLKTDEKLRKEKDNSYGYHIKSWRKYLYFLADFFEDNEWNGALHENVLKVGSVLWKKFEKYVYGGWTISIVIGQIPTYIHQISEREKSAEWTQNSYSKALDEYKDYDDEEDY